MTGPLLLCLALCGAAEESSATPPEPVDAPVLVQFTPDAVARLGGQDAPFNTLSAQLVDALDLPLGTTLQETALSRLLREERGGAVDVSRWMLLLVKLPPGDLDALEAVVARLSAHTLVRHAEPDFDAFGWAPAGKPEPAKHDAGADDMLLPDDPLFPLQYYHRLIRTPQAWRITTGSEDVTVAVIDSGCAPIDDLAGRLRPGYDFVRDMPDSADAGGHGTAIAALVAAMGNNGAGLAGMDWRCRILPINAVEGGLAVWAQAIEFAVHAGARVINISGRLALPGPSRILEAALGQAVAAGAVIVASAGNQNEAHLAWPAASPNVIAVGATDGAGHRWQDPVRGLGSNYGPGLDLVAPGEDIVTLGPNGRLTTGEGTSPAAALVSGACALMYAAKPELTPAQVRQILCETADKVGPARLSFDGFSEEFGYGRLNVYRAVQEAQRLANK